MKKIFITGANGFIGTALINQLSQSGYKVYAGVRKMGVMTSLCQEMIYIGDICESDNWSNSLKDIDIVVHLAARAHIVRDNSKDSMGEFLRTNVIGSRNVVQAAIRTGARRFVYISSIGAMTTLSHAVLNEKSNSTPDTPYGVTKLKSENVITNIAKHSEMETVILRPPLVYGPAASGNFRRLIKLLKSGMLLPLGSVENQRSFIYIGNLVDAIIKCIEHPAAANKTFLVSDGEDLSTPELIRRLSFALGVKSRLFKFPVSLLKMAAAVVGKSAEIDRLTGNLVVDSSKIRNELGWIPPYSVSEGLTLTAEWYKNEKSV